MLIDLQQNLVMSNLNGSGKSSRYRVLLTNKKIIIIVIKRILKILKKLKWQNNPE